MRGTHGETASKHESGQTMTVIWIRGSEPCCRRQPGRNSVWEGWMPVPTDYLIKPYDVRDLMARIRRDLPVGVLNR